MSSREVVFLGTSSQVPTRARAHNAFFLRWDDAGILFDPGEGTQRQLIFAGITTAQITHIAITHFHGDHCLGLAGIVQRISLDGVAHEIEVLYPASGEQWFGRLRHASIFLDKSRIRPVPISREGEATRVGKSAQLIATRLDHAVDCFGWRLQEDDGRRMLPERLESEGIRGPAVGELARRGEIDLGGRVVHVEDVSEPRPGQSVAAVMDTRACDGARRLMERADLVVCESTFLESERAEADEYGHLTAAGAARLALAAGARRLALTHFSQRYVDLAPFRTEAAAIHPDVHIAEDLAAVSVPERR